jgi:23S rRNA (guanosine2251-2'-O)-methyltransferase
MNKKTFWIGGTHAVHEAIKNPNRKIKQIVSNKSIDYSTNGIETKIVDIKKINKIFLKYKNFSHQNIAAEVELLPKKELISEVEKIKNIVMLDGVTDVRNIGSIIRSAVAFNFDSLIIGKRIFDQTNPIIIKSSSGAIEKINIFEVTNLSSALEYLKKNNFWSYALDSDGNNCLLKRDQFSEKNILILGSEGNGISRNLKQKAYYVDKITISKKMESLNVSNAAAIAFAKIYSSIN